MELNEHFYLLIEKSIFLLYSIWLIKFVIISYFFVYLVLLFCSSHFFELFSFTVISIKVIFWFVVCWIQFEDIIFSIWSDLVFRDGLRGFFRDRGNAFYVFIVVFLKIIILALGYAFVFIILWATFWFGNGFLFVKFYYVFSFSIELWPAKMYIDFSRVQFLCNFSIFDRLFV